MEINMNKLSFFIAFVCILSGSASRGETKVKNDKPVSVVLIHGAFSDGSSWNKVIPILQAQGLNVIAVQNPLTSLSDDVLAAQRAIDAQEGSVVLVGHSWGGTVITQVGNHPKVKSLVYVAAHAPSEGQTAADLGKDYPPPPGKIDLKPDAAGFLRLSAKSLGENFAQDLPHEETKVMAATQGPIFAKAFAEPVTVAAWTHKPSYYIVASQDRMIQPALQQALSKKIKAVTTVLESSHVPMLSLPDKVAEVIITAAMNRK